MKNNVVNVIAYACNTIVMGDRDEGFTVKGQPGEKKVVRTYIKNKQCMVVKVPCNPSYKETKVERSLHKQDFT
jgi:hypothetical protein